MIANSVMKNLCFTLLLLGVFGTAQAQLNAYKYIVVPTQYDIFTEENQFQTSTHIKYLFHKKGFNVVYDNALPEDLTKNRCLGATVDLETNSNLLRTKVVILLKDCNSVTVFRSAEGSSKKKDFRAAYQECIEQAFISFQAMSYKYEPQEEQQGPVTVNYEGDVRSVDDEELKTTADEAVVTQVATPEEQLYKDLTPEPTNYTKKEAATTSELEELQESTDPAESSEILIANQLPNGYELVDNTSKVRLTLLNTSSQDVYLAKHDNGSGMVYKKDSKWYFEYYENSQLVVKEINIKF